jgi:hypothetical protein
MRTYEDFMENEGKVYGYKNITEELYYARETVCRDMGACARCPIGRTYHVKGYSCNRALDAFPEECLQLIKDYRERRMK